MAHAQERRQLTRRLKKRRVWPMTQQPGNLRASILSHGYRLRFAVAVVSGVVVSALAALADPGATGNSGAHTSLASLLWPLLIPFCLLFLATLFLLGEMGQWTACRVGTIRSGILTAAIAGACFGLGEAVASFGISAFTLGLPPGSSLAIAMFVLAAHVVNDAVLFGIVGALAGSFGAVIGRSQYRYRRQWSEQPQMIGSANEVSQRQDGAQAQPIPRPGYYEGRHFTSYAEEVRLLKWSGDSEAAERLLLALVDATEAESRANAPGWEVAPWCYEELARLYRSRMDFAAEVAILERFHRHPHAPGAKPTQLLERLDIARAQLEGS